MAALIEASNRPGWPAPPVLVVSNRADAAGLAIAQAAGIPTAVIESRGRTKQAFEEELDTALSAHGVELLALAGFLRILSPAFVARWPERIVNIHPSLLPRHKGLDTHARALSAGDRTSGCTVHLVTEGVDEGPILAAAEVPILAGDTAETLAARVLDAEHRLYPDALAAYARTLLARRGATG